MSIIYVLRHPAELLLTGLSDGLRRAPCARGGEVWRKEDLRLEQVLIPEGTKRATSVNVQHLRLRCVTLGSDDSARVRPHLHGWGDHGQLDKGARYAVHGYMLRSGGERGELGGDL